MPAKPQTPKTKQPKSIASIQSFSSSTKAACDIMRRSNCASALQLHGIDQPNIWHGNTLTKTATSEMGTAQADSAFSWTVDHAAVQAAKRGKAIEAVLDTLRQLVST